MTDLELCRLSFHWINDWVMPQFCKNWWVKDKVNTQIYKRELIKKINSSIVHVKRPYQFHKLKY